MTSKKFMKKKIHINGETYFFNSSFTISLLLDYLGVNKQLIVLDYNGTVLQKEFWSKTKLKEQDKLEILTIAGGG